MRRICVYCASNLGTREDYANAARDLAAAIVEQGLELVYGGSSKGIMGVLADGIHQECGQAEQSEAAGGTGFDGARPSHHGMHRMPVRGPLIHGSERARIVRTTLDLGKGALG